MHFNSHAHVERDSLRISANSSMWSFQLTRSRGAWHKALTAHVTHKISTHTLTWSVTPLPVPLCLSFQISTHTLTWSVTHSTLCWHVWKGFQLTRSRGAWPGNQVRRISTQRHFNSHAHVERDALSRCLTRWRIWISTHTLTWSVTSWRSACRAFQNFNSHAHVERDLACFHFFELLCQFQLTRSRGAWRPSPPIWAKTSEFQLTRSRGAWLNSYGIFCLVWNFNSHAHVERDSSGCSNFLIWAYFNSHAHVERDRCEQVYPAAVWYFNSHAHVERDFILTVAVHDLYTISTHTLTWSVTWRTRTERTSEKFQLTRSRGAWPNTAPMSPLHSPFQLTRSRGAWRRWGQAVQQD